MLTVPIIRVRLVVYSHRYLVPGDFGTCGGYDVPGTTLLKSTLLGLRSGFGHKPAKVQVACPQNGTAVLVKGVRG